MDAEKQSEQSAPQFCGTDARPVILVLIEDNVTSLASLLLATEIAAARRASLHVVHVTRVPLSWVGVAGPVMPPYLWDEANQYAVGLVRGKVASLLALTGVAWTFTWTVGSTRRAMKRLMDEMSPVAVMVCTRRRRRLTMRPSAAQWLAGRPGVTTVVMPTARNASGHCR